MVHPSVLALGYSEAGMLLKQPAGTKVKAIITIQGRYEPAFEVPLETQTLALHFDDVHVPDMTGSLGMIRWLAQERQAKETGRTLTPPNIDDVRAILDFALVTRHISGIVLSQCKAGISRSRGCNPLPCGMDRKRSRTILHRTSVQNPP